jgi:hypothetical protein
MDIAEKAVHASTGLPPTAQLAFGELLSGGQAVPLVLLPAGYRHPDRDSVIYRPRLVPPS